MHITSSQAEIHKAGAGRSLRATPNSACPAVRRTILEEGMKKKKRQGSYWQIAEKMLLP